MTHIAQIEFENGAAYTVGQRVEFYAREIGWTPGTVIDIDDARRFPVRVQPDHPEALPRSERYLLNPIHAANYGKPDFIRARDHGVAGGNLRPLDDSPKAAAFATHNRTRDLMVEARNGRPARMRGKEGA